MSSRRKSSRNARDVGGQQEDPKRWPNVLLRLSQVESKSADAFSKRNTLERNNQSAPVLDSLVREMVTRDESDGVCVVFEGRGIHDTPVLLSHHVGGTH